VNKLRIFILFLFLLPGNGHVIAQIGIPGVVIIHTWFNEGYFQICFEKGCIATIGNSSKKKKFKRRGKKYKRKSSRLKRKRDNEAKRRKRKKNNRQARSSPAFVKEKPDSARTTAPLAASETIVIVEPLIKERISIHEVRIFKNVYFDSDKWNLSDSGKIELSEMFQFLQAHPKLKIRISAHTDNQGSATHNMNLSEKRAKSVQSYLIILGLQDSRIKWKAFGASKPITSNVSAAAMALNRRVEYILY